MTSALRSQLTRLATSIACGFILTMPSAVAGQSASGQPDQQISAPASSDPTNDEAYQALVNRINEAELELRIRQASGRADTEMIVQFLEEVDAVRQAFVTLRPSHPLTPKVRLDRAYDLVFRFYELQDLRLRSFYGTPTPAELESIAVILDRLTVALDDIDACVQAALDWYEAQPTFADDETLQTQRGELARIHRDVRMPLAKGSLAFLRGMYDPTLDAQQQGEQFKASAGHLRELVGRLQGAPQATAGAMLAMAGARARLGTVVQGELQRRAAADKTLRDQLETNLLRATVLRFQGMPLKGIEAMEAAREALPAVVDDLTFSWALLRADAETQLRIAARGRASRPNVECFDAYLSLALRNTATIGQLRRITEDLARHAASIALVTDQHPLLAAGLIKDHRTSEDERARLAAMAPAFESFDDIMRLAHLDAICPSNAEDVTSAEEGRALRSSIALREDPDDLLAANMTLLHAMQRGSIDTDDVFEPEGTLALRSFVDQLNARGVLPPANVDAWYRHAAWSALQHGLADAALDALDQQTFDNPFSAPLRITAYRLQFHAETDDNARRRLAQRIVDAADEGRRVRAETSIGPATLDARFQLYAADALLELDDVQGAAARLASAANLPLTTETVREAQAIQVRLQLAAGGIAQAAESARALLRVHGGSTAGLEVLLTTVLDEAVIALVGDWRSDLVPPFGGDIARLSAALLGDLDEAFRAQRGIRCGFLYLAAGKYDDAVRAYESASPRTAIVNEKRAGLAEALFHRRASPADDERAFTLFREVTQTTDDGGERTWIDWLAHLRQLEILDRLDRNTNQIGPRIRRLQAEDPELGGPAFRASFQVLIDRYLADDGHSESSPRS